MIQTPIGAKLTSTEVVVRDGVSFEQKTFENDGAISIIERKVTKNSYANDITKTQERLDLLKSLRDACVE